MPDERPPVWVGHVALRTQVLDDTETFMEQIGMRKVFRGDDVAILELRGGTHIALIRDAEAEPAQAGFDLMVEDLDAVHADYADLGLPVSDIERGNIHDSFVVTEPGGSTIVVNSSHVTDQPV